MLVVVVRWLSHNLSSMLLALILAVVVWVSAVLTINPNEERTYVRNLDVTGMASNLVLLEDIPSQVRVTIKAPRSILDTMTNNFSSIQAWIDLNGLEAGSYEAPVQVKIDTSPVRLVRIDPQSVPVSIEKLITKTMPVDLEVTGDPSIGYRRGVPQAEPTEVTITGRESRVNQVTQVLAQLDITGATESIKTSIPAVAYDQEGRPVADVTVAPRVIEVTQPVTLLGGYRTVVVKVVTSGQLAPGYRLTQISVTPPTVTVFSTNPQLVNDLPGYVETLPLDLNGLTDDIEMRMELNLPQDVTLVGEQSVLVQVGVAAIEGSLTISVPVEAVGLPPDLMTNISPRIVDLIVSGPIPVLDSLTPESFRVIVDLAGLEIGTYQLAPVVDLVPEEIQVEDILPETVEVIILEAPTPTTTPTGNRTPATPTPTSTPTPTRTPTSTLPLPTRTPTPRP